MIFVRSLYFCFFCDFFCPIHTRLSPPPQTVAAMSFVGQAVRSLPRSSRCLSSRLSTSRATTLAGPILSTALRSGSKIVLPSTSTSSFSTMTGLNSAAPPASAPREYDPEIKDMASYVHNYKVESDVAVCCHHLVPPCQLISYI